jgi:hypothetical protein
MRTFAFTLGIRNKYDSECHFETLYADDTYWDLVPISEQVWDEKFERFDEFINEALGDPIND